MSHRFSLHNQVALVTGASRGLGQALAVGLAEAGADVGLIDINDCRKTESLIQDLDRKSHYWQYDLQYIGQEDARQLIDSVQSYFGQLNILVNNAGIIRRSPAKNMSEQDWSGVISLNLNTIFYLSQAAGSYFLSRGTKGKIINLASMLSYQGGLQVASYASAKSGVAGLTRALSNEWASHGIHVNAIAPGYFKTEVTRGIRTDPVRNQKILERIPAGAWGDPNDLKGAVVFLASDASQYVHGTVMAVDGGWLGR